MTGKRGTDVSRQGHAPGPESTSPATPSRNVPRVCVAKIGAAHGVRGEMRLWPFTHNPLGVLDYGEMENLDGTRRFTIAHARVAKDHLIARIKGVDTREQAEALNHTELYIPRARLPALDDSGEYYIADLVGLNAVSESGAKIGRVVAVHNFGAGDMLEIKPLRGPTRLYPFSDAVVPHVDLAAGRLTLIPPTEIEGDAPPEAR